jgi:hypothetical protein
MPSAPEVTTDLLWMTRIVNWRNIAFSPGILNERLVTSVDNSSVGVACYPVAEKAHFEMKSVYLLWYVHGDDELLIGVYETEDHAEGCRSPLKLKPGFADRPGEFEIAEYQLNQDHWTGGYKIV